MRGRTQKHCALSLLILSYYNSRRRIVPAYTAKSSVGRCLRELDEPPTDDKSRGRSRGPARRYALWPASNARELLTFIAASRASVDSTADGGGVPTLSPRPPGELHEVSSVDPRRRWAVGGGGRRSGGGGKARGSALSAPPGAFICAFPALQLLNEAVVTVALPHEELAVVEVDGTAGTAPPSDWRIAANAAHNVLAAPRRGGAMAVGERPLASTRRAAPSEPPPLA